MRRQLDEEADSFRRLWIDVAAQDGAPVGTRCITCGSHYDYELLRVGEVWETSGSLSCYRRKTAGWYRVTAYYQDAPPAVTIPKGKQAELMAAARALEGTDPPAGAVRLRDLNASNVAWIYLNAVDAAGCEAE